MSTNTLDLSTIDIATLTKALAAKKADRLNELIQEIAQAEVKVEQLRAEEAELLGKPAPKIKIKGMKKVKNTFNPGKRKSSKGGATVKDQILAVLKKAPSSSKDIVKKTGLKSGSVSQALNVMKSTDKTIKHDGKKGGLWSLK